MFKADIFLMPIVIDIEYLRKILSILIVNMLMETYITFKLRSASNIE
jgi:hypothetical protein